MAQDHMVNGIGGSIGFHSFALAEDSAGQLLGRGGNGDGNCGDNCVVLATVVSWFLPSVYSRGFLLQPSGRSSCSCDSIRSAGDPGKPGFSPGWKRPATIETEPRFFQLLAFVQRSQFT